MRVKLGGGRWLDLGPGAALAGAHHPTGAMVEAVATREKPIERPCPRRHDPSLRRIGAYGRSECLGCIREQKREYERRRRERKAREVARRIHGLAIAL